MGSFENLLSGLLDDFDLLRGQLLAHVVVDYHVFLTRHDDLLIDVLDECLDEWRADLFDTFFEPDIVVEELSLAS